ncbi:MAG: 1-(5-phosphoribosyl)-5-[(5-phosphoribosylamino)methylideneamino]imidazole-4-carboxamide isomerase [Woeseiaceae bacterium]
MTVIPAIDLCNGRCVRLYQGDFTRETVYGSDAASVARSYRQMGLGQLHIVDLDGARHGEQRHQEIIANIVADSGLAVQLGGGIRKREILEYWLAAGVSRCVIGSLAVSAPAMIAAWLEDFGTERIVLALDVRLDHRGTPALAIGGWAEAAGVTLWESLDRFSSHGLKHLLCTDIARDGALSGPNLELYSEIRRRYPALAVQASGGVRHLDDLRALRDAGCAAAISGRALLDGCIKPQELVSFLQGA